MRFTNILFSFIVLLASGCVSTASSAVKANGSDVARSTSKSVYPFYSGSSSEYDATALCDACKRDFPSKGQLAWQCYQPCGYGYAGIGMSTPHSVVTWQRSPKGVTNVTDPPDGPTNDDMKAVVKKVNKIDKKLDAHIKSGK